VGDVHTHQAVTFDVDGVLLDTRDFFRRIWGDWASARSLDPDRVFARTHGRRSVDTLREVAPHLDPAVELGVLDALVRDRIDQVRPFPGAGRLLRALRPEQWAIVTSGTRWFVDGCFGASDLPLPAIAVYGEDVHRGKPAPDGYLIAARRLGVPPEKCVVIEDAPSGVAAARSAGCTVIAVATTHPPAQLREADACVPSLSDLDSLLWTMMRREAGRGRPTSASR
jgi:sugar-phosphatase